MRLSMVSVAGTLLMALWLEFGAVAQEKEMTLKELPKEVLAAIKKRFPEAKLLKASKEEDGEETAFEVSLEEEEVKFDVTLDEEGEIEEVEKSVDPKKLPKPVLAALKEKFGKAKIESAEAVYEMEDGLEELEYYVVQLETADDEEVAVKVKASGKILPSEESDKEKDTETEEEKGKESKKGKKSKNDGDEKESENEKSSKKKMEKDD